MGTSTGNGTDTDSYRMHLDDLAPEIILAIFRKCVSIADVNSISQCCRRMHSLLSASQKTLMLYNAAETEFGPLHDVLQLLTLNDSQPAHFIREPPQSDALLRQIVIVGRIAQRWEEIYPSYKWDSNFADRRSLNLDERRRLRRALYRYWLYAHAFHNAHYPRTSRRIPHLVLQRTHLLHNWSTKELIEIDHFQAIMRALISTEICPSNSLVQEMGTGSGDYLPISHKMQKFSLASQDLFHNGISQLYMDEQKVSRPDMRQGWGDPVTHYYVVEDMLKLDPGVILWLRDHSNKWQVEGYLDSLGEWFYNNGDTFSETLTCVLERRGLDPDDKENSFLGVIQGDCVAHIE